MGGLLILLLRTRVGHSEKAGDATLLWSGLDTAADIGEITELGRGELPSISDDAGVKTLGRSNLCEGGAVLHLGGALSGM